MLALRTSGSLSMADQYGGRGAGGSLAIQVMGAFFSQWRPSLGRPNCVAWSGTGTILGSPHPSMTSTHLWSTDNRGYFSFGW